MPRKAARQSVGSAARSSSKRAASPKVIPARQSKRTRVQAKASQITPTKSGYFRHDTESEGEDLSESEHPGEEASGYEDEDAAAADSSSNSDDEDEQDYDSEEDAKPAKRGGQKKAPTGTKGGKVGKELWRAGAETGLDPGTQIIIKKPKPRAAGKTPYTDDTIHPNTFLFLQDLAKNNDREWLKMHDPDYRASLADFTSFAECLTEKIIAADETVPELPLKDVIFRIYRDIRFSPDPTPYKTYFSAAWSRTGRKGPYAAYYVQIQPEGSFVGGGLWMPSGPSLARLRQRIDRRPQQFKRVLTTPGLRQEFFGGIANDENKAVAAFVKQNAENALKTRPQGYEKDHEEIELLRLRNFTVGKKLPDDKVTGPKGLERIAQLVGCMVPFVSSRVVLMHCS
ncbi:hypothetical protein K490DRAFT_52251 [Saccharata proteae CBS 121410]|uniref:Uncharacterized protein n=1 Tax=Saccharata proteae CBS 121410 TaxID=1314787 RepID=A0A9P4LR54_9PEZI|nr:hypothetical protein K490DRAFT_52251 [Saccharata proteae CBS 121410]